MNPQTERPGYRHARHQDRPGDTPIYCNAQGDNSGERCEIGEKGTKNHEEENRFCQEITIQKRIQPLEKRMAKLVIAIKRFKRCYQKPNEPNDAPNAERYND